MGASVLAAACLATRLAGQLRVVNVGGAGGAIEVLVFGLVFLLSYTMGTDLDLRRGLVGVALLVFAVNVINDAGFNPFIEVLAVGLVRRQSGGVAPANDGATPGPRPAARGRTRALCSRVSAV